MNAEEIKTWWFGLSDRERRLLTIGGIFLGLFLFYVLVWSPLSSLVSTYHTRVTTEQSLLLYLQSAQEKIRDYEARGIHVSDVGQKDLLTTIEQSAAQHQLSAFLKQVEQPESHHIQLTFEKVPFDQCMEWLQELSMNSGIRVVTLSADRLTTPIGTANLKIMLM